MMRKYFCALALLSLVLNVAFAQSADLKKLEDITTTAIKKAYAASVRCYGFDTVKKQQNSSQFSAVSVKDGYILTVAHAIVPGNTYKIRFADGRETIAVALGEITDQERQGLPDMGLMKLLEPGDWPYAEMGWSYSLKRNEPCISISYPETLNLLTPTVRFGRITNPADEWGFVVSTCKMEPGDSGGGLFDYMGRVIALHSRIAMSEDVNFEVPVDKYRQYWSALLKRESYKQFPAQQDEVGKDPEQGNILILPYLETLPTELQHVDRRAGERVIRIRSAVNGSERYVLGTVFNYKGKTVIVSKSSEVGDAPELMGNGKGDQGLRVLKRDHFNDLVLLQAKSKMKAAFKLDSRKETDSLSTEDTGRFLLSPIPSAPAKVSVISASGIYLPRKYSVGYFGAGATFIEEKITITRFGPSSPAAKVLKLKDHITQINGVIVSLPPHYGAELMKYNAGDTISIDGMREGVPFHVKVGLTSTPAMSDHPAEHFAGGKSRRPDGFKGVFIHDAALRPEECGGPVLDREGNLQGINIARFSRTASLAVPLAIVKSFIGI
ncbi:S1 family peptidase [Pedobacter faecalis]|uniref:S1 family peptidase n=1 Tax=Pedobacter faecalis TaxID=3041495 RepID=UPI002550C991|nr:trypsin-like peptidase domain-containing protein [Pedobacter sp. ELA7]